MTDYYGDIAEDADVYLTFNTNASTGAAITATVVVGDIEVYRQNTGAIDLTQRSSTSGFTLDVDHDAVTGTHMVAIDTSDNTDAGFFAIGYDYFAKLNTITIDGISVSKWIGHWSIENRFNDVNVVQISGDATAADNLESQYDTTGLIGPTFPSYQDQVSSIAAAPGVGARPFVPSTITVTSGSGASGSSSDMANDDTLLYTVNDNAGTLTLDLDYQMEAGVTVIQYVLTAAAQGNSDDLTLQFYDQVGLGYDNIDTILGANSLTYAAFDKTVVSKYTTPNGLFQVRITGTGLSSATLTINKSVSYGISASNTGIPNGSSITLATSIINQNYIGNNWTLALGGQDISNAYVSGASVTGIATTPTGEAHFEKCHIGDSTIGECHIDRCNLGGTLTIGTAGDYLLEHPVSDVAGSGNPVLDMNSVIGATSVSIRGLKGGLTVNNLITDHTLTIGGDELGAITLNGADATVELRGIYKSFTNNLTGSPTVNTAGAINAAQLVDDVMDEDLSGHNVGGSFAKAVRQTKEAIVAADGAVNDASATTTTFITNLLGPEIYKDVSIVMINGLITGESNPILSHNIGTGEIVVEEGFSSAPANGATFNIGTTHVHPVSQIQAGLATEAKQDAAATNIGTAGAGLTDLGGMSTAMLAQIFAGGDIDGYTFEESMKIQLGALGGKLSGAGTATEIIRAADDSKVRITATVDALGNRTAITLDGTG